MGVGVSGIWYTGFGSKHFDCPSLSTVKPQSVMFNVLSFKQTSLMSSINMFFLYMSVNSVCQLVWGCVCSDEQCYGRGHHTLLLFLLSSST